jgi:hypothetical protein
MPHRDTINKETIMARAPARRAELALRPALADDYRPALPTSPALVHGNRVLVALAQQISEQVRIGESDPLPGKTDPAPRRYWSRLALTLVGATATGLLIAAIVLALGPTLISRMGHRRVALYPVPIAQPSSQPSAAALGPIATTAARPVQSAPALPQPGDDSGRFGGLRAAFSQWSKPAASSASTQSDKSAPTQSDTPDALQNAPPDMTASIVPRQPAADAQTDAGSLVHTAPILTPAKPVRTIDKRRRKTKPSVVLRTVTRGPPPDESPAPAQAVETTTLPDIAGRTGSNH